MFLAPHHIAPERAAADALDHAAPTRGVRWTWIRGTRYGGIRWL